MMRLWLRVCSPLALCLAGCGSDSAAPAAEQSTAQFAKSCALSIRIADDAGVVSTTPIIEPEHVASIAPATAIEPGERAVVVTLTPPGERRMFAHTRSKIGQQAVVYCGDLEVFRARIMEPLGNNFRVNLPAPTP